MDYVQPKIAIKLPKSNFLFYNKQWQRDDISHLYIINLKFRQVDRRDKNLISPRDI